MKKIRFQENRIQRRRRDHEPRERWVFEPIDAALVAVIVAIVIWLQWLMQALPA